MHRDATGFAALQPGTPIGPHAVTVGLAANERYWRAAGADHPALRDGALYPPIAANLTVLAFQATCPEPVIQTRQRVVCHRRVQAGCELVTTGAVTARYAKRGRDYVDITVTVTAGPDAESVWTSEVTFTPARTRSAA